MGDQKESALESIMVGLSKAYPKRFVMELEVNPTDKGFEVILLKSEIVVEPQ